MIRKISLLDLTSKEKQDDILKDNDCEIVLQEFLKNKNIQKEDFCDIFSQNNNKNSSFQSLFTNCDMQKSGKNDDFIQDSSSFTSLSTNEKNFNKTDDFNNRTVNNSDLSNSCLANRSATGLSDSSKTDNSSYNSNEYLDQKNGKSTQNTHLSQQPYKNYDDINRKSHQNLASSVQSTDSQANKSDLESINNSSTTTSQTSSSDSTSYEISSSQNSSENYLSFKSQELERIKWQAFEEGRAAATDEYAKRLEQYEKKQDIEENLELEKFNALQSIASKLTELDQQLSVIFSKLSDQCLVLSHAIACKVVKQVQQAIPLEIIADYLHNRLPTLRDKLHIDIEVNPEQLKALDAEIQKMNLASILHHECHIRFHGNNKISVGDCTIKVEGGSFAKDHNQMLKEIEDVLQNYLVHSTISKKEHKPNKKHKLNN